MPDPTSLNVTAVSCSPGIDTLRELVRAYFRDGPAGAPEVALRSSARLMCRDARARGIQVEELLVSLKRTWPTFSDGYRFPRSDSSRLLARVVTICVEEYYAPLG